MELLSPAGNSKKLKIVYQYGADAAYIGINNFSLRQKADNFSGEDWKQIQSIKKDKKLYGAFNIYFHNSDLGRLQEELDLIAEYPLDAFIISDIGALPLLQKRFPEKEFHLSTQANCINVESARLYQKMGFHRIILGREVSLNEIKEIKQTLPNLQLETFVHGAMCLAYSGRCFLSRYMTDRSGNYGDCAHTCRWQYQLKAPSNEVLDKLAKSGELVIEEELRPNEYFPLYEGEGFTTILSSRDLCLIDHLKELVDAGIDSFKIEGRMKSLYYAAVITRAYRKAIDQQKGMVQPDLEAYREEIFKVSHREFTTGFFFDNEAVQHTTGISYLRKHIFIGDVIKVNKLEKNSLSQKEKYQIQISLKNQIKQNDEIELIGPNILFETISNFILMDGEGNPIEKLDHGKECFIELESEHEIQEGFLLRRAIYEKERPQSTTGLLV